jgi:hypothetical protein
VDVYSRDSEAEALRCVPARRLPRRIASPQHADRRHAVRGILKHRLVQVIDPIVDGAFRRATWNGS